MTSFNYRKKKKKSTNTTQTVMLHKQIQNWMNATTTKQKQLSKTCLAFSFRSPKMTKSFPCFKLTRCDIFHISVIHIWQHKSFFDTMAWCDRSHAFDRMTARLWQPCYDNVPNMDRGLQSGFNKVKRLEQQGWHGTTEGSRQEWFGHWWLKQKKTGHSS